jgi:hypothetical protein
MAASSPGHEPGTAADDTRRWWICGATTWSACIPYAAPTARSALAEYRRDVIAAERAKGWSVRDATEFVRAAGLCVVAGPLSTAQARERDFGYALAWAICDARKQREIPQSPASLADAKPWLTDRKIQVIRTTVDQIFASTTTTPARSCRPDGRGGTAAAHGDTAVRTQEDNPDG